MKISTKERALRLFKNRLVQSNLGDGIGKIILFGSTLRGKAGKDSDIDVLIFASRNIKEIEVLTETK